MFVPFVLLLRRAVGDVCVGRLAFSLHHNADDRIQWKKLWALECVRLVKDGIDE